MFKASPASSILVALKCISDKEALRLLTRSSKEQDGQAFENMLRGEHNYINFIVEAALANKVKSLKFLLENENFSHFYVEPSYHMGSNKSEVISRLLLEAILLGVKREIISSLESLPEAQLIPLSHIEERAQKIKDLVYKKIENRENDAPLFPINNNAYQVTITEENAKLTLAVDLDIIDCLYDGWKKTQTPEKRP